MADFYGVLLEEEPLRGGFERTSTDHVGRLYDDCVAFRPPTDLPPFRLVLVEPINSNTLRAFLSAEPRHYSPLSENDALLRDNWNVSLQAGEGTSPVLESVGEAQAQPDLEGPIQIAPDGTTVVRGPIPTGWSVDLTTDRRVLAKSTYLTIAAQAIESADGAYTIADAGTYDRAEHPGIFVPRVRAPVRPVKAQGSPDLRYDFLRGTYALDGRNDVDTHTGLESTKKRVVRRLLTYPGEFYHLPNYGAALRVKRTFSSAELGRVQSEVLEQVLEEDDIIEASVAAASPTTGVLVVTVRGTSKSGPGFELGIGVDADGPFLV